MRKLDQSEERDQTVSLSIPLRVDLSGDQGQPEPILHVSSKFQTVQVQVQDQINGVSMLHTA